MSDIWSPTFSAAPEDVVPEYSSELDINEDDILYFYTDADSGEGSLRDVLRNAPSNATIAPDPSLFYDNEVVIYLESPLSTNWHGRNIVAGQTGKIHLVGDGTFAVTSQYGVSYIARGTYEDIVFEDFKDSSTIGILGTASRFSDSWLVNRCMFLNCSGVLIRNLATVSTNFGGLTFKSCLFVNTEDGIHMNRVYGVLRVNKVSFVGCTANDNVIIGTQGGCTVTMTDTVCSKYYNNTSLVDNEYSVAEQCEDASNNDYRIKRTSPLVTGATVEKIGYDFVTIEVDGVQGAIGAISSGFMTTVFGENAEIALYAMGIATPDGINVSVFK